MKNHTQKRRNRNRAVNGCPSQLQNQSINCLDFSTIFKPVFTGIGFVLMGISNWVVSNGMNYIVERLPQPNIHNVSYSPTLITKTVGINNTLDDFIVTVPQNRNPNHLTDGEQVRLSYHDNNSGFECSILVNVKIVDDPKAVNADFYLNKATLRRLGLNPDNGLGLYHIEMFSK